MFVRASLIRVFLFFLVVPSVPGENGESDLRYLSYMGSSLMMCILLSTVWLRAGGSVLVLELCRSFLTRPSDLVRMSAVLRLFET